MTQGIWEHRGSGADMAPELARHLGDGRGVVWPTRRGPFYVRSQNGVAFNGRAPPPVEASPVFMGPRCQTAISIIEMQAHEVLADRGVGEPAGLAVEPDQ